MILVGKALLGKVVMLMVASKKQPTGEEQKVVLWKELEE